MNKDENKKKRKKGIKIYWWWSPVTSFKSFFPSSGTVLKYIFTKNSGCSEKKECKNSSDGLLLLVLLVVELFWKKWWGHSWGKVVGQCLEIF